MKEPQALDAIIEVGVISPQIEPNIERKPKN